MAHWVFSSDRYNMPWHIKSRYMNVLFDQGLLGAALWGMLLVGAPWRTSLGGFAVLGLFGSLVDVPWVACLFYLLVLVALTLPRQPSAPKHFKNNSIHGPSRKG
jgi:hypothetical protein